MIIPKIVWWAWVLMVEGIAVFATLVAAIALVASLKRKLAKIEKGKKVGKAKARKKR